MFFPKPWTSKSKSDQRICNFKSSAGFCCWLNRPSNWQTGPHHPTPSLPGWGVWLAFLNTWFIWLIRRERISTKTLLRRIPVLRWSRGREYPARCTFQTGEVSPNQQQPDEITDLQYIFCVQIQNWRIKTEILQGTNRRHQDMWYHRVSMEDPWGWRLTTSPKTWMNGTVDGPTNIQKQRKQLIVLQWI